MVPGGQDPTAPAHDLRRLVVTDTRVEDEGYFTCHVHDQNGHENSRQEFVAIQGERWCCGGSGAGEHGSCIGV